MICEKKQKRSLTVAGAVAIGKAVWRVGGVFQWIKNLFAPKGPMKIEVTINVPAIHVFTHGSELSKAESVGAKDGSGSQPQQARATVDNSAAFAEDDKLAKLAEKFGKQQLKTPEVSFGFESPTSETGPIPKPPTYGVETTSKPESDIKPTAGLT